MKNDMLQVRPIDAVSVSHAAVDAVAAAGYFDSGYFYDVDVDEEHLKMIGIHFLQLLLGLTMSHLEQGHLMLLLVLTLLSWMQVVVCNDSLEL